MTVTGGGAGGSGCVGENGIGLSWTAWIILFGLWVGGLASGGVMG